MLAAGVSPLLSRALAIMFLAWVALGHAAIATLYRTAPVLRGRLMLLGVLALGVAGSGAAVLAPLSGAIASVLKG